jgi:hypothetical protein
VFDLLVSALAIEACRPGACALADLDVSHRSGCFPGELAPTEAGPGGHFIAP